MDTIVFLITLSAGALAVHYKERLRYFVPKRQAGARVLVDQSLGLARLELPDGWRQAQDLNETASIEAIHALHGRHVIVISDSIEDFVPEMTVYEHSVNTRTELTGSIQLISCTGPERRTIGGLDALQYQIEGFFQQTRISTFTRPLPAAARFIRSWPGRPTRVTTGNRSSGCSTVSASCPIS